MNKQRITATVVALIGRIGCGVGAIGCGSCAPRDTPAQSSAGPHAGPQHEDDHETEPHVEEEYEEGVIHLNEYQLAALTLSVVEVRYGSLTSAIELPGEVQWNTDRLVHVTPRVAGIVASVLKTLGDEVEAEEALCVLDSREMGDAKMEYLADLSRFALAEAYFERARIVLENTRKLLDILEDDPTPDQALTQARDLPVGDNKNKLLTGFTRMQVARRHHQRTRELHAENIVSEAGLLEAQGADDIARADYLSTREEIVFNLPLNFLRAQRDFDLARTEQRNSQRALHILGLSSEEIRSIADRGDEIDTDISRNVLRSPMAGRIVDRHLTRGELVSTETKLYTIADLTDVWVMGRVYERDVRFLERGQKATVRLDAFPGELFDGVVDYIASHLDPDTRTVEARVVLPNPKARFRPGMFGTVTVFANRHDEHASNGAGLLVPVGALQRVKDGHVVFALGRPGEFRQVSVLVLRKSRTFAQISGDIVAGDRIVVGDTFVLKSEVGKEEMGGGHAH
ncbi:MAG: efflux RND transporter periplasmic adaptor subunit [Planctomycetes bacterium]|nr:efflux RND transporter periplasmic adaptor subunit [Planctomycetota bacterium]